MPTLHIQLLGDLNWMLDDTPLKGVNSPRLEALLAYLLLFQVPHNRQQLAFQFWPDSPEAQARANLRFFLHRLRRVLPEFEKFLEIDDASVRWRSDAPCTLDVAQFEYELKAAERAAGEERARALEKAVGLYRGDLLPDCYDDWILGERERLQQLYTGGLGQLSQALENEGDYRGAITYAQQLLRYDPLHEETYRHLMQLYVRNGDQVNALRTFHTCAAVLERELQIEPSAATRTLYEHLVAARPAPTKTARRAVPESARLRAPGAPPNNLRLALTSFIGRERESREVKRLLGTTRLLTLTGVGGSGKTRLALEVAAQLLLSEERNGEGRYADGVWWAELAALKDPAFVIQAVTAALGMREQQGKPLREMLLEFLREKQLLLVLDNCEHLIGACAELAESILQECPEVSILATSREPLRSEGERAWAVPPLALPEMRSAATSQRHAKITASEAVRLFEDRSALALPTFELTPQNTAAVAQICRKLDGLPLAIELAAARIKVLKVEQIAARLDDRLHLLTAGPRREGGRHQSLRAMIDWSYELLGAPERLFFQRLAMFAGGFTLDAAEAVCTGNGIEPKEVLELVSLLADKSLISVAQEGGETRFNLLETIGQYAVEKLVEANEAEAVQSKHLDYYLRLAERANVELEGPEEALWLERLEREHGNLRAGLVRALEQADGETVLRLATALGSFWNSQGHLAEGRQWLEASLAASGQEPARAQALLRLSELLRLQGDLEGARIRADQSLAMWKPLDDKRGIIDGLIERANIDFHQSDFRGAYEQLAAALALARELGDRRRTALVLYHLAVNTLDAGGGAEARKLFEESLALFRELGWNSRIGFVLNGLGEMARVEGDYDRAEVLYEECRVLFRGLGNKVRIAVLLSNLGFVALHRGEEAKAKAAFLECLEIYLALKATRMIPEALVGIAGVLAREKIAAVAVQLLAAASAVREANHGLWEVTDRAEMEWITEGVRTKLDEARFERAWAEGSTLTQEEAVEMALHSAARGVRIG